MKSREQKRVNGGQAERGEEGRAGYECVAARKIPGRGEARHAGTSGGGGGGGDLERCAQPLAGLCAKSFHCVGNREGWVSGMVMAKG
jgi:hypothetical protein